MKVLIEIPQKHYDQFVAACDRKSPEYILLKNACICHDRTYPSVRWVQILCEEQQADMLREAAMNCFPKAAPIIGKMRVVPPPSGTSKGINS